MRHFEAWRSMSAVRARLVNSMVVAALVSLAGCPGPASPERPRARPAAERPTPRPDPLKELAARAAQGKDRSVRLAAVRELAKLGTRAAAEAMIEAVDGESLWLRPAVADGLVTMPAKVLAGLEVAIEVLVAELRPTQKARFRRLAHGLAAIGDPAVVALLRAMPGLSTRPGKAPPNPKNVTAEVARALAAQAALVLMGSKIVPTLLRLARDGIQGLDRFALDLALVEVLGSMGPEVLPQLIAHFGKGGRLGTLVQDSIQRMGAAAAPALVKLMGKPGQTAALRKKVVAMLGRLQDTKAQEAVLAALKDPDRSVSEAAARALAKAPTEKAFVALAQRIKSGTKAQRLAIVKGASAGTGDRSARLLRLVLLGGGEEEAVAAARAIGDRGDKGAVTPLLQLLKRRSLKLRQAAIRALGALRVPKTFKTLARLARRGKKELRLAAIAALGSFNTKPAKKLLGRLKRSRNKAIAKAASNALSGSGLALLGGSLGIPACDAYFRAMLCYLNLLPAAAKGPAMAAFKKSVVAWRKMAAGPGGISMAKTCKMVLAAWGKAVQNVPQYRRCVKP